MNRSKAWTLAALAVALGLSLPVLLKASEARPTADEQCLAQCDARCDQCMAAAGGDESKQQACDDAYTECLKQCR